MTLVVVTRQKWRVDELGRDHVVRRDFGFDVRAAQDPEAVFWCPGSWAAGAVSRYSGRVFSSAGPRWLDSLPIRLTGREVATMSAREWSTEEIRRPMFAKLPETKHECFDARVRSPDELFRDMQGLPSDEPVSVQDPVVFTYEVRCWVRGRRVTASSPYVPDMDRDQWPDRVPKKLVSDARHWLSEALGSGGVPLPPAAVVDVGWCEDPPDGSESGWRIVEANAPWSSDWYLADLRDVVPVIVASQTRVPPQWVWQPSALLRKTSAALARR